MRNKIRRTAERVTLAVMASVGTVVLVAEPIIGLFGGNLLLSEAAILKIILLILSTVTLFLLLEVERFQLLDNIDARLSELDIETIAQKLKGDRYAGIVAVHDRFPEDAFVWHIKSAKRIVILNTWIPNLHRFESLLTDALNRGAEVQILLLNPNSGVAQLRDEALGKVRDPTLADNVKDGVKRCLAILESILNSVDEHRKSGLEVRIYKSLPSISVYRADVHYFMSAFLHGQLAIDSPQCEIDGSDTIMGKQVGKEIETLWGIGEKIDVKDWRTGLDLIR